ncbi:MAG: ATP-dependent helicase [Lachnospiraceae bacterium]|nr:ATP-dependent helicase [Lachnospiraceae bacterium]
MIKKPTQKQLEVLEHTGNIVVTAKPGSGKTFTVVEKIANIMPSLPDYQGVIAISFTNKASDELKRRCRQRGVEAKQSFFGTIDKFYISQIIIPFASHLTCRMPEYEVVNALKDDSKYSELSNIDGEFTSQQESLLLSALNEGKIFLEISGEIALYILKNVPGAINFMKARYTHIFIDEYQDCGEIQHTIFLLLVENGLTGIAVGDINQAIYGFSNRFPKYLISLIGRENFKHIELNKNHRCHPSISEYSLCLFNASKQILEEKRVFKICVAGDERNIAEKIDQNLSAIKEKYGVKHNNGVAILCRNNGIVHLLDAVLKTPHKTFTDTPLDRDNSEWGRLFCDIISARFDEDIYAVDYAEQLFSEEIEAVKYHKALNLCQKIFSCCQDDIFSIEPDIIALAQLVYPKKKNESAIATLNQILTDNKLLNSYIPASKNEINLMTLHKSKGLEFNIVFHMDLYKWILPNEYGDEDAQIQDLNLHYVGVTRAIDVCYLMNGTTRYRSKQDDFVKAEPSPFLFKPGLPERRYDVIWK